MCLLKQQADPVSDCLIGLKAVEQFEFSHVRSVLVPLNVFPVSLSWPLFLFESFFLKHACPERHILFQGPHWGLLIWEFNISPFLSSENASFGIYYNHTCLIHCYIMPISILYSCYLQMAILIFIAKSILHSSKCVILKSALLAAILFLLLQTQRN